MFTSISVFFLLHQGERLKGMPVQIRNCPRNCKSRDALTTQQATIRRRRSAKVMSQETCR